MASPKLITIVGPTGTGKTALALTLAKILNTEIISADSRQVYKDAHIGTNKLPTTTKELSVQKGEGYWNIDGVYVHLYDVVFPHEAFAVGEFVKLASALCTKLWNEGRIPIIAGGTGFYIDALTGRRTFSAAPQLKDKRREWINYSNDSLLAELKKKDPYFVESMHYADTQNKQRLLRYLELAVYAGSVLRASESTPLPDDMHTLWVGLTADRRELHQRADEWVNSLFWRGIVRETQALVEKGYKDTPLMQGMIYKQVVQFLEGTHTATETLTQIQTYMHAYIRRQLVWFRRNTEINWFDVSKPSYSKDLMHLVELFVER